MRHQVVGHFNSRSRFSLRRRRLGVHAAYRREKRGSSRKLIFETHLLPPLDLFRLSTKISILDENAKSVRNRGKT